jgi:phenylacetate-CoA ligase
MTTFATTIRKYKPRIVVGYASSLYLFAKFLETEGIEIPCPQGVQSSAEMLHDWQRSTISAQFGCPVFDRYGCREVGNIAHECSAHDGLHVSQELMHVEVLKDGEHVAYGEEGDIVITSFTNYAFPFIRYHIGDRGVLLDPDDSCTCGRCLIKMSPKVGRSTDNFYFKNGLIVHGEFFTHLFYDVLSVRQFQVVQKSYSKIVIRIVPSNSQDDVPVGPITEAIRQSVGLPIDVDFEFTDRIKSSPTGKHRFTISEVQPLL